MPHKLKSQFIEDETSRQLCYAKRRNGLIKKALELFIVCGVDSLFISFSPSGRLSYFCGDKRIEDVLVRFAELPEHVRRLHLTDDEYHELLGILNNLKQATDENFRNDSTVQSIQGEIDRVKAELEHEKSELSKYLLSPESITTIEEANAVEANLEDALAKVRDRLEQLSANLDDNESEGSDSKDGDESQPEDFVYNSFLAKPEDQGRMFDQAPGTERGQVKFLARNSFQETTGSPPQRFQTFTSQLLSADAAQTSSPRRETVVPQTSVPSFTLPSPPPEHSLFHDSFFDNLNNLDDPITKGAQSSNQMGFDSPDTFVFPTANPLSPNYQFPYSHTQMVVGESSRTANLFGRRRDFQGMFDSDSELNDLYPTDTDSSDAFFKAQNQAWDPRGNLPHNQENIAARPYNDQNPSTSAPRPRSNAVYSTDYDMMGLAVDPHFRIFREANKDGSDDGNENPNQ